MARKHLIWALIGLAAAALTACGTGGAAPQETEVVSEEAPPEEAVIGMANPASVYCEENGGKVDLRQDASGGVAGICVFADGSECDEWAYLRGECKPGGTPAASLTPAAETELASDGWRIYRNETLGYSFHYPAEAEIITADDPLQSLTVSGPGMGNETWMISHPSNREEYRPPEGVDLSQWLTDHHLVGEKRLADVQIAGTTAIHFRHERSPQSYADDRYYFTRGGQLYLVLIGHGDVEDWELSNRFLQSFQFLEFGFIYTLTGFYCEGDHSLGGKAQRVGEMIIASLQVP